MKNLRYIKANEIVIAIIGNMNDISLGKNFYGSVELPLQVGTFYLTKGDELQPHIHKVRNRQFKTKTIEFIYIVQGALKAVFYDNDKKKIGCEVLREKDFVILYDGGHGFRSLKESTKLIEVKLGSFTNIEDDKEKFDDKIE